MVNCNLTLREPLSCHQGFCSIESKFAQATERRINTPIKTWQSRVRPQALSAGGHAVHHAAAPPPLRDVAGRVIKSNDLEESILLPSKGQVSTIRARSWHFHSLLVQKYWTKKIRWQKKKKKRHKPGSLETLENRSLTKHPNISWRLLFRAREAACGGRHMVPPLWVTVDLLFLIAVGHPHEQLYISSRFWKSHFLVGKVGSCLFW